VTGYGLAGHALEMARGANSVIDIDWRSVPLLAEARALAGAGNITGASGRNWASYGDAVQLGQSLSDIDRALLTDPQTSGGLLVACSADSVNDAMDIFRRHGFDAAQEIGVVRAGTPGLEVR
jgi:selenide,water dikinase